MEFSHLGTHCAMSDCNQQDFLPIECGKCNKKFCRDHSSYSSHKCSKHKENSVMPQCSICSKFVWVKIYEDSEPVMRAHVKSGCKVRILGESSSVTSRSQNVCTLRSCKKRSLLPIHCNSCKASYCAEHRHPEDHKCSGPVAPRSRITPKQSASEVLANAKKKTGATNGPRPKGRSKSNKQVEFQRISSLKHRAVGDSRIPVEDRVYLQGDLPQLDHKDSICFWVSKASDVSAMEKFLTRKWGILVSQQTYNSNHTLAILLARKAISQGDIIVFTVEE